ncbi:hypothetical protein D3C80_1694840 [compost metagenome]
MKFKEPVLQQSGGRRGDRSDRERSLQAFHEIIDFPGGRVRQLQNLLRPAAQDHAGIGKLHTARAALHQLHAELFLQQPQLLAERRLGHLQLPCRRSDLSFLGNSQKVFELSNIHMKTSRSGICNSYRTDTKPILLIC